MEQITDNMQKYANYKEQMGRLKKALTSQFYLEAIFIEYAIMEDRLESILRHGEAWTFKEGEYVSIDKKITKVEKLAERKKSLAQKYFSSDLTQGVRKWKEDRNKLIHALLKQSLHTEDLVAVAQDGEKLTKALCAKSTQFKRALEREAQKTEEKKNV